MKLKKIKTSDGSWTYEDQDLGVTYRSSHGARTESHHVFVEGSGLTKTNKKKWKVLELGFGTGLNFSMSVEIAKARGIELEYISLEPHLMGIDKLLIDALFKEKLVNKHKIVAKGISLSIVNLKWQNWEGGIECDAYYHDPFGPSASPDCWSLSCFEWASRHLKKSGRLTTYGASTAARRAMVNAGFYIAKAPGSGGKREMTIASKTCEPLDGLKTIVREKYL